MLPSRRESCKRQREAFPKSILCISQHLKRNPGLGAAGFALARAPLPVFTEETTQSHSHLHGSLTQQDVQGAPFRERNQPWFSPIISKKKKNQRPSCLEIRGMKPWGVISITLSASTQHRNSLFSKSDRLPGEQIHSPGISGLYHIIPLIKQSSSRLKTVRFLPR